MSVFRRMGGSKQPPRFYIKGSYVLDIVFSRKTANDIDVFYDESCERPTKDYVRAWLNSHGLPESAPIDGPIPVQGFDDCSGGGFPEFNIDRWHIRDDGHVYTLTDTSEPNDLLPIGGRPTNKTRVDVLNLDQARVQPLAVLFPPYSPSGDDGVTRIVKALKKNGATP